METSHAPAERWLDAPVDIDGVVVLLWPEHRDRADELSRIGAPRLLLVDPDETMPEIDDPLADWMRRPPDEREMQQRIVALRRTASAITPIVDDHGVIWRGDDWIVLSPIETRLMTEFLGRPGRVVGRARLERFGWPDGVPNARAIDARIKTLRRRVGPLGVRIHTVRGHGYLAEIQPVPTV
ncbi:MAG TPA: winged helix-turn-helix domain-containing protein [Acidimicrobiia bacterium]|nr:winged helix-turn-helix domain-containing protein [Acidimicrobiia bacterium]